MKFHNTTTGILLPIIFLLICTTETNAQDYRIGIKASVNADLYSIGELNAELEKLQSEPIQNMIITPSVGLSSKLGKFGLDVTYTPRQIMLNHYSTFSGDTSRIPFVAFSIARFDFQINYSIPIFDKTNIAVSALGSVSNPYLLISGIYQKQKTLPYYKWNELWREAQNDGTERITVQFANSEFAIGSYGLGVGIETELSEHAVIQGGISYYRFLGDYTMGRLSDSHQHFTPNLFRMSLQTSYYF